MSEEEELAPEIKGYTKIINKFVEVGKFTYRNWWMLALFGTAIWNAAGFYYDVKVEPQVQTYVRTIVYEMGKDSIPVMIHSELDTILAKRGVTFRTGIANGTGVVKDSVVTEYTKMYRAYKKGELQLDTLRRYVSYNNAVIHLFVNELFKADTASNGAIIWKAPSGDTYYFDIFGLLWGANKKSDGNYYFYPPYLSNSRQKCEYIKHN